MPAVTLWTEVLADAARGLHGVLAEIDDPGSELTAHPGTRARMQGAILALEAAQVRPTGRDSLPVNEPVAAKAACRADQASNS